MPTALFPLLVAGFSTLGLGATAATIAAGATLLAVGAGLSFLATAFFAPKQPKPSDGQIIIKQSAAPRFRLYGRGKVGGVLQFANVKQGYFHRVVAMGSGEIDAVEEHWIDDQLVTLDGAGLVTQAKYIQGGTSRVRIENRLGTVSPAVYADVAGAFPALWTADHLGKAIPSAHVRLQQVKAEKITDMFPQLGNTAYRQVQRGAKVPGVAAGAITAAAWSDNAARVILDYLIHPDGLGLAQAWIEAEIATWETAIAECADAIPLKAGGTEPRWRIWNAYNFAERPADVLARFLQACDGQIYPTPNRGLALKVGKWTAPTVTVDDAAIVAFSEIGRSRDLLSTANVVRAEFTSPDHDYQETDAQPWIDTADVAERGEHRIDLKLYPVPSHAQARRLMKLAAYRANPNWTGTLTCNLRALPVMGERFITVRIAELGIDETFEIQGAPRLMIEDGTILAGIQIDVQSLPAAAYDWDAATEEGAGPGEPAEIVPDVTLPVPTGLTVTTTTTTGELAWDAPPEDYLEVEARFRRTDAVEWLAIPVAEGATEAMVGGLSEGVEYEFQIRHRSAATGRVSVWTASVVATAGSHDELGAGGGDTLGAGGGDTLGAGI